MGAWVRGCFPFSLSFLLLLVFYRSWFDLVRFGSLWFCLVGF